MVDDVAHAQWKVELTWHLGGGERKA